MTRTDSKNGETQLDEYRSADQWGQIRNHDALDLRRVHVLHARFMRLRGSFVLLVCELVGVGGMLSGCSNNSQRKRSGW